LLTSVYNSRTLPGSSHNWHEGVMGLAYMYAHAVIPPAQACILHLNTDCGEPPYYSQESCLACAQRFADDLTAAGCTLGMVKTACNNTAGAGEIPVPSNVPGLTLFIVPDATGNNVHINITGPRGLWFGFGFNQYAPLMANATAFVYAIDDNTKNPNPVLQQRVLGNHAEGVVVHGDIPAAITTIGNSVQVLL
jgi:hypothetical protein